MTPTNPAALEAKRSIERIEKLAEWLARNPLATGGGAPGLKTALKRSRVRYGEIQRAIARAPSIALVGESARLRAQMVGALTSAHSASDDDAAIKQNVCEMLRRLLISAGDAPSVAAVRYTAIQAEAPPRDHPFRLRLLSLADVATILVRVHQACFPGAVPARALIARMSDIRKDVASKVRPATLSGFAEADVIALRATVERHYPDAPGLRLLAAANYWDDLAEVAAHIPNPDRIRALSVLWGDEPGLTDLFEQAVNALANIGFVPEVFAAREALLGREAKTGWFVVHTHSILAADTLALLAEGDNAADPAARHRQAAEDMLGVVGRYGHVARLTRPALAALVAEVALPAPKGAAAARTGADVVDLPAAPMPLDLNVAIGSWRRSSQLRKPGMDQLVSVFAHMKTAHLLDRAIHLHQVTTLVPCVAADQDPSDVLPDAVSDWVDLSQGEDPRRRERQPARLFVIAETAANLTATDHGLGGSLDGGMAPADMPGGRTGLAGIWENAPWLVEWTPGEPFPNTYVLGSDRHRDRAAAMAGTADADTPRLTAPLALGAPSSPENPSGQAATSLTASLTAAGLPRRPPGLRQNHYFPHSADFPDGAYSAGQGVGSVAVPCTQVGSRQQAEKLLNNLARVSHRAVKERDLRRQLAGTHRYVTGRLLRYRSQNGSAERDDWRYEMVSIISHRVVHVAHQERLGHLLDNLRLAESELIAIFRRSDLAAMDGRLAVPARTLGESLPPAETATPYGDEAPVSRPANASPSVPRALAVSLAEDVVGYWIAAMRALAHSSRFCREVSMPGWVLDNLVDEFATGADRLGLVRSVSEVIEGLICRTHAGEEAFASTVGAVLNRFLEHLDVHHLRHDRRRAALAAPANGATGDRTEQPSLPLDTAPGGSAGTGAFAGIWTARLARFLDANIEAARHPSHPDAGVDLARLLSEFPVNRVEVEP